MKYLITPLAFFMAISMSLAQSTWSHLYSNLTINDVAEVQNNLWVATDIGLFKVDKTTMQSTHYTMENSALPHNHVQTLTTDQFHNLWIGTYELFLIKIDQGGNPWMVVTQPDTIAGVALAGNHIYSSVADNNGTVWLSSAKGLLSYNGTTWGLAPYQHYPMWDLCVNSVGDIHAGSFNLLEFNQSSNTFTEYFAPFTSNTILAYSDARTLQKNDSTVFYFADHGGINQIQNGNWTNWSFFNNSLPIEPRGNNSSPSIAPNGSIYYNTYSNLLVYFDGTQWLVDSSFAQTNPTISSIEYFFISDNGDFWFFQGSVFAKYNASNTTTGALMPLVNFNFQSEVVIDQQGTAYLAGFNKGIQQYNQGTWTLVSGSENFANFETTFDSENKAWFISRDNKYNPTIVQQTNTGWIMHDSASTAGLFPTSQSSNGTIYFQDMVVNSNDMVFVRDYLDRLFRYDGSSWAIIQTHSAPSNLNTSAMTADLLGNIWWLERIRVSFGVYTMTLKKYDGTTISSYPVTGNTFQKPYIDANNHLWVSLAQGQINEFDGNSWTTHNLPVNQYAQTITGINNHLYVGTSTNGLFEFDGTSWTNYLATNSPLSNNDIRGFDVDAQGNLWIDNAGGQIIDIYNNGLALNDKKLVSTTPSTIKVYPNPAQQQLQIATSITDIQSIKVVNTTGQIVLEVAANNLNHIDISSLNAAVYWVIINTSSKQFNEPFVKL